jgi:hypothetical protein
MPRGPQPTCGARTRGVRLRRARPRRRGRVEGPPTRQEVTRLLTEECFTGSWDRRGKGSEGSPPCGASPPATRTGASFEGPGRLAVRPPTDAAPAVTRRHSTPSRGLHADLPPWMRPRDVRRRRSDHRPPCEGLQPCCNRFRHRSGRLLRTPPLLRRAAADSRPATRSTGLQGSSPPSLDPRRPGVPHGPLRQPAAISPALAGQPDGRASELLENASPRSTLTRSARGCTKRRCGSPGLCPGPP